MATQAKAGNLKDQAAALDKAADALSERIKAPKTPKRERERLFEQSQQLRSQAFQLETMAAEGIVKEMAVEVDRLQSEIDKAAKVLATIKRVKDVITVSTSLVQLASAIATGQPAAIAQALSTLKDDTERVKSKQV